MNIGLIFAGGTGSRMRSKDRPKQFLEVQGKPIIVHTIELFENTPEIDIIVVVMIKEWINYMEELVFKYGLSKVKKIVAGGKTGQLSIFNGLEAAEKIVNGKQSVVLIHDGVRPLINSDVIVNNINCVKKNGTAITTAPAKETVVLVDNQNYVSEVIDRNRSFIARAPQSFILSKVLEIERKALQEGIDNSVDTSTLMGMYQVPLTIVEGPIQNIKITTPDDFLMFKALCDAHEISQIYEP